MSPGRRARWWRWLAGLAVALALLGWWVDRQLEPTRLTALVLSRAGPALGLDLRFEGQPDYAFRPEPRLQVPGLQVRDRKTGRLFLQARRLDISLPWATITGGEPVITRIELLAPRLDQAGLQAWLDSRPPAPFRLPTLTRGLRVREGQWQGEGFRITGIDLDLPRLQAGTPAQASLIGRFEQDGTALDLDLEASATTPGLESDFAVHGQGHWQDTPAPVPFQLLIEGHYRFDDVGATVTAPRFEFDGGSPLPRLQGRARLASTQNLRFGFDGRLRDWPAAWPALPAPLAEQASDLDLKLDYAGDPDLAAPIILDLAKADTRVHAEVRIEQLQAWLQAPPGSPVPPLQATASTPRLEFDGVQLEGVEVEVRDAPAGDAPP